jgi:hypothetical protein
MGKRRSQGAELCAYCGLRPSVSSDHVVPKLLFDGSIQDPITVPVCKLCHDEKSRLDQYLRDYLVADWDGARHPLSSKIAGDQFFRAMQRNRSLLIREAVKSVEEVEVRTPSGIVLGSTYRIDINPKRLSREMEFITRGICFSVTGHRIGRNIPFRAMRIETADIDAFLQGIGHIQFSEAVCLGETVFNALYAHTPDNRDLFHLIGEFYGRVLFVSSFGTLESHIDSHH